MNRLSRILGFCSGIAVLSGCGGEISSNRPSWSSINSTFGGELRPPTDKLDEQCATSSDYEACLFDKSPTAQKQTVFQAKDLGNLETHRKFGVKLTGLDASGLLQSANLQILKMNGDRFEISKMNLKTGLSEESSDLEAAMSYYWLNRAYEFYRGQTGGLAVEGHVVKVIVDEAVSGFKSDTQTIYLSKLDRKLPMAFDASIGLHFLGQANVYWATQTQIGNFEQDTYHRECRGDPRGCCTSALGCSRALVLGSADYFVATIFPQSPHIAETWGEGLKGQSFCGVQRSLAVVASKGAASLFSACETEERGRVEVLGLVYASIWWNVRQLMMVNSPAEVANIDRLHQEHLKELNGSSRFDSALRAIESADQRLFSGRYAEVFRGEFRRRGL